MARDADFSAPTKRLIAQRSAYCCAYPGCFAPTAGPAFNDDAAVSVGEAAHICAASPNGPRYVESMSSEERQDAENGIWMCRTHAALIDRDADRFTIDVLRNWKYAAEDRAMRTLGQPRGCATGRVANISPATRLGPSYCVLVDGVSVPFSPALDGTEEDGQLSYFFAAFVIQFSIQKRQSLKVAVMDHLVVTVHETRPVPQYQMLYGIYPAEFNLFYVDIEANKGRMPLEFRPHKFIVRDTENHSESTKFPSPMILDDDIPAQIALRINAKARGYYLISADVVVSSADDREVLTVMPPQWVIFERDDRTDER